MSEEMTRGMVRYFARGLAFGVLMLPAAAASAQQSAKGPVGLQVDNLKTPLGIDDPAPKFSWQLQDTARGAKQTAYEVLVASGEDALRGGNADVWDSGRRESAQSLNVPFADTPAFLA